MMNKGPVTWGPKRGGPKILVTFWNRKNRWLLLCRVSCVACPCDRETLPKFTCFSTNETNNVYEFVYFFIEMRLALMSLCAWLASIGVNNCYNRNIHYTSASPSFFLAWSIMKWVPVALPEPFLLIVLVLFWFKNVTKIFGPTRFGPHVTGP